MFIKLMKFSPIISSWIIAKLSNISDLIVDALILKCLRFCFSQYIKNIPKDNQYSGKLALLHHLLAVFLLRLNYFSEAEIECQKSWLLYTDPLLDQFDLDMDRMELLVDWGKTLQIIGHLPEAENKHQNARKIFSAILKKNTENIMSRGIRRKSEKLCELVISILNDINGIKETFHQVSFLIKNILSLDSKLSESYIRLLLDQIQLSLRKDHNIEIEEYIQEAWNALNSFQPDNEDINIYRVQLLMFMAAFLSSSGSSHLIEAEKYLHEAWRFFEEISSQGIELQNQRILLLVDWGNILRRCGRLSESLLKFELAVNYTEKQGTNFNKALRALVYQEYVETLTENKNWAEANKLYQKSLILYLSSPFKYRSALDSIFLSSLLTRTTRLYFNHAYVEAEQHCQFTWELLNQSPSHDVILEVVRVRTLTIWGLVLSGYGRYQESHEKFKDAEVYFKTTLAFSPNANLDRAMLFYCWITTSKDIDFQGVIDRSKILANMLELSDWKNPSNKEKSISELYSKYHAYWLATCMKNNDYIHVPIILNATHGRKQARLILDELDQTELSTDAPDTVKSFKCLRKELHQIAVELKVLSGDQSYDYFSPVTRYRFGITGTGQVDQNAINKKTQEHRQLQYQYQSLRKEVVKLPEYQHLTTPFFTLEKESIQHRLKPGQVLLLLVDLRFQVDYKITLDPFKISQNCFFWWLLPNGESYAETIDPSFLTSLTDQLMAADILDSQQNRNILRKGPDKYPNKISFKGWEWYKQEIRKKLWKPFEKSLRNNVKELIVITHGRFHRLPLTLGRRHKACTLFHYLSLPYFLNDKSPQLLVEPNRTHIAVKYMGEDLLLAREEGRLLTHYLWHETSGHRGLLNKQFPTTQVAEKQSIGRLYFACHGNVAPERPEFTSLNLGTDNPVTFHDILSMPYRPEEVFIGACVAGQTFEDRDGDPLGPVTAFMLHGAKVVVACLTPVPDLYMPLLSFLTEYTAISKNVSLDVALEIAKKKLDSWQTDSDYCHLAESYQEWLKPILADWLENRLADDLIDEFDENEQKNLLLDLAQNVLGSRYYAVQNDLLALIKQLENITDLRTAFIDYIRTEFSLQLMSPPQDVIDLLTHSVRAFGRGGTYH